MDPTLSSKSIASGSVDLINLPDPAEETSPASSGQRLSRTTGRLALLIARASAESPVREPVTEPVTEPVRNEPAVFDLARMSPVTPNYFADQLKIKTLADNTLLISFPKSSTDDNFQQFFRSTRARTLDLGTVSVISFSMCTKLTGSSLDLLGLWLSNVQKLDLSGCSQLTDSDFSHLDRLNHLESLSLAGCVQLSTQGFRGLSAILDNVKTLDLTGLPQLDDEFLSALKEMHQIQHLVLTGCTGFTDAGLSGLKHLGNLETLLLDQCSQLTDKSLLKLRPRQAFENLVELNLNNCPLITNRAVQRLQAAMPHITTISHL